MSLYVAVCDTQPKSQTHYHTKKCRNHPSKKTTKLITQDKAIEKGLDHCKYCQGIKNELTFDCPLCGETVGKLPAHLPYCEAK